MDPGTRIETAIAPWLDRTDRPPPFTCADLAVIALALHDEPMSAVGISEWAQRSFAFYRRSGINEVWNYWNDELAQHERHEVWSTDTPKPLRLSGWRAALKNYYVPFTVAEEGTDDVGDATMRKFTVEPAAAMLFLRPKLWPEEMPSKAFPFLRLPPDIRNIVYEMVFAFPSSGIQIGRHECDSDVRMYTTTRSFDQPFSFDAWKARDPLLHAGKVPQSLRLLLVNRQIRSEALYVFASVNTFYFTSAGHMFGILARMSEQHRDNVRDVAFAHIPGIGYAHKLPQAFALLARMKRLKRLRVYVDQEEFRRYYHYYPHARPIDHMLFDRAARIPERVEVVLGGDYLEEVEKQIRSAPLSSTRLAERAVVNPKRLPQLADTDKSANRPSYPCSQH